MHDPLPEVGEAVGVGSALDVGVLDVVAGSEIDVVDAPDPDVVSDVVGAGVVGTEVGTTVGTVEVVVSVGAVDVVVAEPGWVRTGTLVGVDSPEAAPVGCVSTGTLVELTPSELVVGALVEPDAEPDGADVLVVGAEVETTGGTDVDSEAVLVAGEVGTTVGTLDVVAADDDAEVVGDEPG